MNRPLLALALALTTVATGCDGDDSPPGDVIVYWGFVRNTAAGAVLYDAVDPGGSVEGACSESGVEYVRVTRLDGRDVDPSLRFAGLPDGAIPCVVQGAHGVTFRLISPGTHTWNVTGYRTFQQQNGSIRDIPVAQSSFTFDVRPDRLSEFVVDVQPIQDDVTLVPAPWDANNVAEVSCAASGIAEIDLFLWTFAGDAVLDRTFVGCGPVVVRLDRDDYEVRMRGFPSSAATTPTHDTNVRPFCNDPLFITQLGPDGGGTSWLIDLFSVGPVPCP